MSYLLVAILGLAFGSFLNVCIFRLPRYESIVTPRSRCTRCNRLIRWHDNIPVLSYLVLGGRCRDCRERISPIYPTVEILTAGVLVAGLARYGATPEFVKYAVLGMLLIVLMFTDFTARKIPHAVTLLGMAMGLALSFVVPVDDRLLELFLRRFDVFPEGAFSSLLGALSGGNSLHPLVAPAGRSANVSFARASSWVLLPAERSSLTPISSWSTCFKENPPVQLSFNA